MDRQLEKEPLREVMPGLLFTSFRDPAGSVVAYRKRILRAVNQEGLHDLALFLKSPTAVEYTASGRIVGTRFLRSDETAALLGDSALNVLHGTAASGGVVEHERIPFPSYPYEWAPEMLHSAGRLTLDLAQALLKDGLGLKDATPYNVLFRGPEPVFVDVLSCERRDRNDPTWLPYAQFVRTFLLPLLVNKYLGIGLQQSLLPQRDGLDPQVVYRWSRGLRKYLPPFLGLVSVPAWLGRRHDEDDDSIYRSQAVDQDKARFILDSLFNRLRRTLDRVSPPARRSSVWSDYMSRNSYSPEEFLVKERFVRDALAECGPKTVLDVGCNTGHFSALAAGLGASVVAIDYDPVVIGAVWRRARSGNMNILPLVVDLTRPTPGMGWLNREAPSFLDRARASFDTVMMLAAVHHMLVTERVPLDEILELAAALTRSWLVIEFIAPEDPMFRRLLRGRAELHAGLNQAVFEQACRKRFDIARSQSVEGTARRVYLLRKRN